MYADCYILIESRQKLLVDEFIKNHLDESYEETAEVYEVPESSNEPKAEFDSYIDLVKYLEEEKSESQRINWTSVSKQKHVSVFYTEDGSMIFCISCIADTEEDQILTELQEKYKTTLGYISYEKSPPSTAKEFKQIVHKLKNL